MNFVFLLPIRIIFKNETEFLIVNEIIDILDFNFKVWFLFISEDNKFSKKLNCMYAAWILIL